MKNSIAYKTCLQKLHEGMFEGNMHECLRDTGSIAGGYFAGGYLSHGQLSDLQNEAVSMSKNKSLGERTWLEGVDYGKKKPLTIDFEEHEAVEGRALDWDDEIGGGANILPKKALVDDWLEGVEIPGPKRSPIEDMRFYLRELFQAEEKVSVVIDTYEIEGKFFPSKGVTMDCGKILKNLEGSVEDGIGTPNPEVGGWVRFNPLDGTGVKDTNVTAYRYALVESDVVSIEKQYAIIKELQMPVKMLVHSGKKSLHAIVKIDADTLDEYKSRVEFLYEVCKKNGLGVDRKNRNPSRLSRLPGLERAGNRQYIVDSDFGFETFAEWEDYIKDSYDDLPEMDCLEDDFLKDEELSPTLISGVLRQGHKLLVAGPSKAGKSFCLIQLTIAIAEGAKWLGWQCAQGRVLYVNLELDPKSCRQRFRDVYKEMGMTGKNVGNIDIWNLRGKSAPMDKLAPKLIRRALKKRYMAVIIDPIYKVITGDENSADQMAKFCNQFDLICSQLGASTIYCHHHSKGSQGQKKSSDRASGSGVFTRDPDAILDLIELELPDSMKEVIENDIACKEVAVYMDKKIPSWRFEVAQDDQVVIKRLMMECEKLIGIPDSGLSEARHKAKKKASSVTAWRVEGTLREFATFDPKRFFFKYPIHVLDDIGILVDAVADGEAKKVSPAEYKKQRKEKAKAKSEGNHGLITDAYDMLYDDNEPVSVQGVLGIVGCTERTLKKWVVGHPSLEICGTLLREKRKTAVH